ncbi:MAG: FkbM family methyltransferase [Geminicoccaceae bacterium]
MSDNRATTDSGRMMVNAADPAGPLLREAMRREYRGKYRLYSTLRSWGWLSRSVTFHAGDLPARVPADEWTYWKYGGPWTYAGPRHDALARIACSQQGNFDAIDLGADVGVVALSLHKRMPGRIESLTAVEPNPRCFPLLEANLASLPYPVHCLPLAIGADCGSARLVCDRHSGSDHGGHVVPLTGDGTAASGEDEIVPLTTLDDLVEPAKRGLLVKMDIEGQEQAALEGGRRALASRDCVVLMIEIHPDVLARIGGTPEDIMAAAEAIRPFEWWNSDPPVPKIDRNRPFLDQMPPAGQYDIIGLANA